jgi:hypothetical protein
MDQLVIQGGLALRIGSPQLFAYVRAALCTAPFVAFPLLVRHFWSFPHLKLPL